MVKIGQPNNCVVFMANWLILVWFCFRLVCFVKAKLYSKLGANFRFDWHALEPYVRGFWCRSIVSIITPVILGMVKKIEPKNWILENTWCCMTPFPCVKTYDSSCLMVSSSLFFGSQLINVPYSGGPLPANTSYESVVTCYNPIYGLITPIIEIRISDNELFPHLCNA